VVELAPPGAKPDKGRPHGRWEEGKNEKKRDKRRRSIKNSTDRRKLLSCRKTKNYVREEEGKQSPIFGLQRTRIGGGSGGTYRVAELQSLGAAQEARAHLDYSVCFMRAGSLYQKERYRQKAKAKKERPKKDLRQPKQHRKGRRLEKKNPSPSMQEGGIEDQIKKTPPPKPHTKREKKKKKTPPNKTNDNREPKTQQAPHQKNPTPTKQNRNTAHKQHSTKKPKKQKPTSHIYAYESSKGQIILIRRGYYK